MSSVHAKNLVSRRAVVAGMAVAGVAATIPGMATAAPRTRRNAPSLILLNGDIRLMDRRDARVQAVAVREGLVLDVGSNREIRRLAGRSTSVIDLDGRTALPGINDSHVHGHAAGVSLPPLSLDVGYPTVTSIADIVTAVRGAVQQQGAGAWIRGSGWNTALLEETRSDPSRLPTKDDLDAVSPDNPVILRDFSFHTVWANSKAMELAGITRDTPEPPGGVIDRDAAGDPIGLFRENAQPLILAAAPTLSVAEQASGLQQAVEVLLSQGITSYTDPGLTADEIAVYRSAVENGVLRSRVTLMLSSSRSLAIGGTGGGSVDILDDLLTQYPRPTTFAERHLVLRGVKIFGDGIPPNLTGWVYDPYLIGGGHGELVVAGDTDDERVAQVRRIVARAHRAGYQVGTHATGDRAIDVVVDAYLRAMRGRGPSDPRHYTIHSDLATDAALRRLARHGLGANMNPSIKAAIADAMIAVLGPERAARQWPTKSALRAGVTLTSASDWPVTPPDWRAGVASAVLRKDQLSGNVSGPAERLSIDEALRTYTSAPAHQDGAEDWKGRLTPCMVADIAVLDGRLPSRTEEIDQLADIPVAMTLLAGRLVYERSADASGGVATSAPVPMASSCAHGKTCCCQRAPDILAGRG
jgi:predicted amidohydrolase YtcJ